MAKHKILYYISSHGYGHAVRAGQVIKGLLSEYEVHIKSMAPSWLLEQVIGEKPLVTQTRTDVGCIQKNNHDVDIEATFRAYRQQSIQNKAQLEDELSYIQRNNIDIIVSDVASFPFVVAHQASIPSLFIGNFTWKGIYDFYLTDKEHPILHELHEEYEMATKSLRTPLSMDMPELNNASDINFIARRGKNIREELYRRFAIPKEHKLVFFYTGNLGIEKVKPENVAQVKGHTFISFYPLKKRISNFIALEKDTYLHQDIMASSDIALFKAGYGMVSEAMVNNVPFIYPPRTDFAEYFTFVRDFEKSGGTRLMGREDFDAGNWGEALYKARGLSYNKRFDDNGALQCKASVRKLLR